MLNTLLILACSGDPVLEAAREEAAADAASPQGGGGAQPIGGGGRGGHPMDGGAPGGAQGDPGVQLPGTPGAPEPGIPTEPPPGTGVPTDGMPDAPAPGVPDQPTPGNPNLPPPGDMTPPPGEKRGAPEPAAFDAPTVSVKGTVVLSDWITGTVRIDIFDADPLDFGAEKKIVAFVPIDRPGAFEARVPIETGRIWLSAFNDEDNDGRPGPLDPTGVYFGNPVDLDDGDVSGIRLELERRDPPGNEVDVGL